MSETSNQLRNNVSIYIKGSFIDAPNTSITLHLFPRITTDDKKFAHSRFCHIFSHTQTHLPIVLRLTQQRERWSTFIKCSQHPCSFWYRGRKINFSFSFICFLEALTFFSKVVSWRRNNMVLQQYNLKPTTDKQSQHLCCALATTTVSQAENRWLGEDLANTKTGDFLCFFHHQERYTQRLDYFNSGRSWGG